MADGCVDKMKMYLDIYYAINFIRKVQCNKPSKEKVFSLLEKLNRDSSYDFFDINMDKLVKDNFIEVKGEDDQESLFLVEEFHELFSIYIDTADNYTQTENMDNIHPGNDVSTKESDKSLSDLKQFFDNVTVDKAAHKAPDSMSLLYERMISNLQSETDVQGYLLQWRNFIFEEPIQ